MIRWGHSAPCDYCQMGHTDRGDSMPCVSCPDCNWHVCHDWTILKASESSLGVCRGVKTSREWNSKPPSFFLTQSMWDAVCHWTQMQGHTFFLHPYAWWETMRQLSKGGESWIVKVNGGYVGTKWPPSVLKYYKPLCHVFLVPHPALPLGRGDP